MINIGITTIRLNNREETEKTSYSTRANNSFKLSRQSHFYHGAFMGLLNLSTNMSLFAVLYVGGGLIQSRELSAGTLTQFALTVRSILIEILLFVNCLEGKYLG